MGNCEVYAEVDFGHGPVEIRCTQQGKHQQHRCEVFINPLDDGVLLIPPSKVEHKNIFETED